MRIRESEGRNINLWLPFFLLWPLIAAACLMAPLVFMVHPGFKEMRGTRSMLPAGYLAGILFCSLRGLSVNVKDKRNTVYIVFY